MLVFHSFSDFYRGDTNDEAEKSVYGIINYDIIDVLVVICSSFSNAAVTDMLVENAKAHGVPVVLINGNHEGCWSINANYEDAFKSILNHVIANHNIKDTFFISGNPDDMHSVTRLRYYKEVLEENGINYDESRVAYGQYWEGPVKRIVKELCTNGKKPPKAIFCANDYMAFAACNELRKCGYKVPEDVIVTGFDGVPAAEYFSPQLTTCSEDMEYLAELTVQTAERITAMQPVGENTLMPEKLTYCYQPTISESCGCQKLSDISFRETSLNLNSSIDELDIHENFIYSCIDHMLEIDDMNDLQRCISECILENSYVCLNSNFVANVIDSDTYGKCRFIEEQLVVIPSHYTLGESDMVTDLNLSDMVPNIDTWLNDGKAYILTAIHVGGEVFGYYAVRTDAIHKYKTKIKRVVKAVTIAFNVAINHFRQVKMKLSIETAALTNSITNLPNLKGMAKWFEEFSSIPSNKDMALSVSVYGMPKYLYISENYGISAVEDALRFVGETLRLANPKDCFVAHISDDEFAVINYYDDMNKISETINSATSVFFNVMDRYNTNNGKNYFVEVNAGCTVIDPGWSGSLESYIKFANGEMYMNRLKWGMGKVIKEESTPSDFYKTFEILVEKNMFHYHFQPIVSAKTGEIYAYEALMRTDANIGMNPLQILDTAKEYNRLYDIEKATIFNVMEQFVNNKDAFDGKIVFINTIPGHFLNEDDLKTVNDKYGEYMDNFMLELTEQNTISDEELDNIKEMCGNNHIVIDDYGTGHSNIVNVMRYAPSVIKVDRFLISDIHKNQNKQMFVRSTIEFAKLNGIKVLAEGVETSNELHTVIDLGVDFIQGYYTGRPSAEIITSIAPDIRQEIIEANPLYGQYD